MNYFILNNNKYKSLIKDLIEMNGLPMIQRRLDIFSNYDNSRIEILNNEVSFRKNDRLQKIYIDNKNLKYFFRMFDNSKKYFINDITILNFNKCYIMFNTYHGIVLSTDDLTLCSELKEKYDFDYCEDISGRKMKKKPKGENLFDSVGNLNIKIKEYAKKTGLDIRSLSSSLKIRLSNVGNDYSFLEKYYKQLTGYQLLSTKPVNKIKYNIKNMTIIIPVYNQDVKYTLLSIQGQNISKDEKKKIQVILVDDGSKYSVLDSISNMIDKLDYELNVITLNNNMGLSNARNVGFSMAKYNHIVFLDSDILISKNYCYDMSVRLQLIPNALFICMRKNIQKDSKLLEDNILLSGVSECFDFDDSRVITKSKDYHILDDNFYVDKEISILDDTNCFKELGYGSQIGIYNISTVVTGHNIALNKALIKSNQPFSTKFKGWGMEDAYFASKLIPNGCFVIPVLSSCVYHIYHSYRSGSNAKKIEEANKNYRVYNELLNQIWK